MQKNNFKRHKKLIIRSDACENYYYCKLESSDDRLISETRYAILFLSIRNDFQTINEYFKVLVHWPIKSFAQHKQIDEKNNKKNHQEYKYMKEIRHEMLFNHVKNVRSIYLTSLISQQIREMKIQQQICKKIDILSKKLFFKTNFFFLSLCIDKRQIKEHIIL